MAKVLKSGRLDAHQKAARVVQPKIASTSGRLKGIERATSRVQADVVTTAAAGPEK